MICKESGKKDCIMPHDVKTRWNSTCDMMEFAIEYREVVNKILGERELNLRDYELSAEEWEIATQLRDVLKVGSLLCNNHTAHLVVGFQRCDKLLFT